MSKILVLTGATGKKSGGILAEHIGRNLNVIKSAFPDGIRAVVRGSSNTSKLTTLIPGVELYAGGFGNDNLLSAFEKADTVLHVAGIHGSRAVVSAAAERGVRRLILVHTTGIYSKYKAAGEEYRNIDDFVYRTCAERNIILTILRPTMIYGNCTDQNVVKFIKMVDKLPVMPVVNGARYALQPVHYKDLGKAYFDVLMNEESTANKDFILSGGEPILLKDMLLEIGKCLGKDVKFVSCPFPVAYSGAWVIFCLTFGKMDYREKVQRLCEPRCFPYEEATKAFGYRPMTFQQGIADEVREYLERK